MFEDLLSFLAWAIGGDLADPNLALFQVIVRSVIVFMIGIVIIRIGKRRIFRAGTPLDLLMAIIIGSVLSRTINGSARFTDTIVATATLVAFHWLLSTVSYHSTRFNKIVNGEPRYLIEDGELHRSALRAAKISEADLQEELHLNGYESPEQIRHAWLERNGEFSFIGHDEKSHTDKTSYS
ncbi:MAG: DUF421 domain-containing protein [Chloroflexota bacterium]|jgi:uncharacterized membrane protein YcaP (DUF421 family)